MTLINNGRTRALTRDELITHLQLQIRPKAKREKFEKLKAAALAKAEHVLPVQFR